MKIVTAIALSIALSCLCVPSYAADAPAALQIGDKAPDFQIPAADGKPLKVSDFKGKKNVLVAFYPKAFTPGCTTEMCGFRDDFSRFQNADTEVIAVSVDVQTESDRFKKEKQLQFHVVGDPEKKIVNAYGVPLFQAPVGEVAKRSVFLIDKKGKVRYIDPAYDVKTGKDKLYEAIEQLKKAADRTKNYPERPCSTC